MTTCCDCGKPIQATNLDIGGLVITLRSRFCPECQAREDAREAAVERRKIVAGLRKNSNLPPAAAEWDLERAEKQALAGFWKARYWQFGPEGLYLCGPTGTGKTVTAWCLLQNQLAESRSGLFLHVPEFLGELRKQSRKGQAWEQMAKKVKVLVLDDVGSERPTEWAQETLLIVINHRIDWRLPTIYTSNYRPGDLFERLGDPTGRTADRIVGSCRAVAFEGESFRLAQAKERQRAGQCG